MLGVLLKKLQPAGRNTNPHDSQFDTANANLPHILKKSAQ
jgi:hypothetical protein